MTPPFTLTVGAEAKLDNAGPSLLEALKKQLTIDNPQYKDAQKYGRWMGKKLKPHLYFYAQQGDTITFPRGYANQAILLARKFMRCAPQIIDLRSELAPIDFNFTGQLRPYQQEAIEAITKRDFGVLEAGTGSGKTVIALAVIAKRRQPTLVLVHTKELLYQWVERVQAFLNIEAGLIGDSKFEIKPITIAIVNSARKHLDKLAPHFGQICVDECHRVPSTLFTEVVTAFSCRYLLGLSATAFRRDGLTKLIYMYLGDRVHKVDLHDLHQSGAVLKPQFIQRATEFRYVYRGNYQALMKALTGDKTRNALIVADIVKELEANQGTILVVSDRIKHCEELARLLEQKNRRVVVLTGKLPADQRSAMVEEIRAGEVKVLISTVQLIGEGFDCPDLTTLFLTTPIKFTGRLLQVVGRVLRPAADKQPRVYDYVDPVGVLSSSAQSRWLTFQGG
ncbi:MAG: DEAD/DEAH box helicase [Desulfobulbaceae bacterium]|nr:DEAD/DEAH box helicase [Desulfobulbaceae bacterium]HIJ77950.1 DEAD/DEAH box helicase [Deltaproteobacteria bacterium]